MARKDIIDALIAEQGQLYSEEMGADISKDTPQELFHWLIGAILLSARIDAAQAVRAGRALREAGLHKIDAILDADRDRLVKVLNENGYARYDESTADYLIATARTVRDEYGGDLRRMREGDPIREVQKAKGLGPMGASIFAREMQLVWDELYPVAGEKAGDAARELGLPDSAADLSDLVSSRKDFVRLVAALTRARLDGPAAPVEAAAHG